MKDSILSSNQPSAAFQQGSIFFVGTATVILRYAGFTILTDPNFLHAGDHAHLGHGLKSKRLTNPAIEIEELPPLDFVLLSHMHGDHFDRIAAEKLDKNIPIISTGHACKSLHHLGFTNCQALDTWENMTIYKDEGSVKITATPARHGPNMFVAAALPEVMGSILDFQENNETRLRMYISGDTLIFDRFKEIPKRYKDIDIALLHLGGTKVLGLLVTMDAKQGVEAVKIIAPKITIPIHYNDYDVFKSPLEDFQEQIKEAGLEDKVRYLSHGDTYTFELVSSLAGRA